MGIYDVFCLICGGPPVNAPIIKHKKDFDLWSDDKLDRTEVETTITKYNWLGQWVILLPNNKKAHVDYYNSYGCFCNKKESRVNKHGYRECPKDKIYCVPYSKEKEKLGVQSGYGMHLDCWKLANTIIEKKTGKDLRFDMLNYNALHKHGKSSFNAFNVDYGVIRQHQSQFFEADLAYHNNEYLLNSPLRNKKNQRRVVGLVNKVLPLLHNHERRNSSESVTDLS